MPDFKASLLDPITSLSTISMSATCDVLTFIDESNFDTNTEVGHARASFTDYRRVVITSGSGDTYIMSSIPAADVDESIPTASTTNDTINFTLREDIDDDGLWDVRICNYPTWDVTLVYALSDVTYYNGLLYISLSATTTPASTPDTTPLEWDLYEPTAEAELLTPYCTCGKIAVLCIKILKCKEQLAHKAFCLISSDFCNDDILCKNRDFLNSVKMSVLIEAMQGSVNNSAWNEVEDQFNLLRKICNCG